MEINKNKNNINLKTILVYKYFPIQLNTRSAWGISWGLCHYFCIYEIIYVPRNLGESYWTLHSACAKEGLHIQAHWWTGGMFTVVHKLQHQQADYQERVIHFILTKKFANSSVEVLQVTFPHQLPDLFVRTCVAWKFSFSAGTRGSSFLGVVLRFLSQLHTHRQ